jgi:hypothetical protein
MSVTQTDPPRAEAPEPDPPRRARPSAEVLLLAAGVVAALVVYVVWQTYPNYDTYYTLVWGQELFHGRLPDYDVFRTPTPHPLSTLVAWAIAPFGTASDRLLVLVALLGYVGFLAVMFAFTKRLLGRTIAFVAVAVLLTRTDMQLLALRAMFDLPFYLMVFAAALLELRRPRAGWPVLALLMLAGLLRPEAWLLGGVYWLWLARDLPRGDALKLLPLVVAAPLLWMLADAIVTGEPLYSLTSTREVSGEFGRNRGIGDALRNLPRYSGANDTIVTVGVGGMGLLLAVWLLRRKAALPLALGGLGLCTFLIISAAGLSVIPRYMTIPSLLLTLCVAVALAGWTQIERGTTARKVAVGVAVLSVLIIGWRGSYYASDFSTLARQASFVESQHEQLNALIDDPEVAAALQACRPVTVPTHAPIPILRYETGMPKDAIQASIQQDAPPTEGLQLVSRVFNFEPSTGRAVASAPRVTVERRWSTRPAAGFERLGRVGRWSAWARCGEAAPPAP